MRFNWKTILWHLLFWVLYIIIWGIRDMPYAGSFVNTLDSNFIGSLLYSIGVYLNLYILVPKLLMKGKRTAYVLAVVPLVVLIGYLTAQVFSLYFLNIDLGTSQFFDSVQGMANTGGDFLVVFGLATCLYFINEWNIKERRVKELETTSLKSELELLKNQINPHFLFNALNSIHVLIRKDPEKATSTLEKFSEVLSHQIYEVKKEKIPLKEEVDNLDNFIQIQKLRKDQDVKVAWATKGEFTGLMIAPMLFLNFVENAFKYCSGSEGIGINIKLSVTDSLLEFICINCKPEVENGKSDAGIGLANVKRRLEILYPDSHELIVDSLDDKFEVKLTLNLGH